MPYPTDPTKPAPRQPRISFNVLSRKSHYYLGLYFLFFLWLFTFTGLLLNHGSWTFAEFWPSRKVSTTTRPIKLPDAGTDFEQASNLMQQLGIFGEIEWPATRLDPTLFEFRVNRPGHNFAVSMLLDQSSASVQHTEVNGWGVLRSLHSFTGVRIGDARNERDWILTNVWAFAMDALAVGMVFMVLTGLNLWWGLRAKRTLGALALALGILVCGLLVAGVRLLTS